MALPWRRGVWLGMCTHLTCVPVASQSRKSSRDFGAAKGRGPATAAFGSSVRMRMLKASFALAPSACTTPFLAGC
eukprot:6180066-Pleurochrysis_carterae.AAC.3